MSHLPGLMQTLPQPFEQQMRSSPQSESEEHSMIQIPTVSEETAGHPEGGDGGLRR